MYIPLQEQEKENKEHLNFIGGLFKSEETFGDKVAADIDALQKANKEYTMSKTTKALIGVAVAAVVIGGGYFVIKKMKKK